MYLFSKYKSNVLLYLFFNPLSFVIPSIIFSHSLLVLEYFIQSKNIWILPRLYLYITNESNWFCFIIIFSSFNHLLILFSCSFISSLNILSTSSKGTGIELGIILGTVKFPLLKTFKFKSLIYLSIKDFSDLLFLY